MSYKPEPLPLDIEGMTPAMRELWERDAEDLHQAQFHSQDRALFTKFAAPPARPEKGGVYYADGSTWNPGSGEGLYFYNSSGNFVSTAGRSSFSIFEFLTQAQIADVRSYVYAVDLALAISTAIAALQITGQILTLYFPSGGYRIDSTINISGSISIQGDGHAGQATTLTPTTNIGTIFKINHLGFGFSVGGTGQAFKGFAVFRPQTVPAPGWAPYPSNFDFKLAVIDCTIDNILFWGTNKGISMIAGGRLMLNDIRGQFFSQAISVDGATDCIRMNYLHFFPMWSVNSFVLSYMLANFVAIELQRVDGPYLTNYFVISCKTALLFNHSSLGDTTNFKGSNLYLDNCGEGIITSTTSLAVTAHFSNVNYQSDDLTGTGKSIAVRLRGIGATIGITNFQSTRSGMECVRNTEGTSNELSLSGSVYVSGWNSDNNSFGGINTNGTGNFTSINTKARTGAPVFGAGTLPCAAFIGDINARQGMAIRKQVSATTDATGEVVIPHGLGYTPGSVDLFIISNASGYHAIYNGADNTNIVGNIYLGATAAALVPVSLNFTAFY